MKPSYRASWRTLAGQPPSPDEENGPASSGAKSGRKSTVVDVIPPLSRWLRLFQFRAARASGGGGNGCTGACSRCGESIMSQVAVKMISGKYQSRVGMKPSNNPVREARRRAPMRNVLQQNIV
jgi:hypothetical protein